MADEHDRVWAGSMPDAYERWLVPAVFRPFAIELARRVAVLQPRRVLELAAGTGVVTNELYAAIPDTELVATDLNDAMIAVGSSRAPRASWRQADAQHLEFGDGSFDVVTCQFGVMFFPDRPAAYAEARRVLGPGGRLVFNSWDTLDTHGFGQAVVTAMQRALDGEPPGFLAAVPHGYADPELIRSDLAAAGYDEIELDLLTIEGQASAADIALGFCTGTPLRGPLEAHGDLDTVVVDVTRELEGLLGSGTVTCRMNAYFVAATAPGS